MISYLRLLAVLLATASLAACTVFPLPEPPRMMDLAADGSPLKLPKAHDSAIRVETPLASSPFDSSQILVKPTPYEFQSVGQVRWRDTIPVMIRDNLIQHLRNSQGFRNVIVSTSPADARFTLVSELTAFHASAQRDDINIVIQLHAEVMSYQRREGFCAQNWTITEPVTTAQADNLVAGFSAAANRLNNELTNWLHDCLTENL